MEGPALRWEPRIHTFPDRNRITPGSSRPFCLSFPPFQQNARVFTSGGTWSIEVPLPVPSNQDCQDAAARQLTTRSWASGDLQRPCGPASLPVASAHSAAPAARHFWHAAAAWPPCRIFPWHALRHHASTASPSPILQLQKPSGCPPGRMSADLFLAYVECDPPRKAHTTPKKRLQDTPCDASCTRHLPPAGFPGPLTYNRHCCWWW